jgi:hypothetical protein
MVARDHLPEVEAGNHTATSGGPTGSRIHAVAWPCAPAAVAVIKAIIIIIPSPMRANLYALMQCGEDSEYGHTVATLRCFGRWWWRTVSPHCRQAGTSNLLMNRINRIHGKPGSLPLVELRSICSGVAWSKAVEDFEDRKNKSKL